MNPSPARGSGLAMVVCGLGILVLLFVYPAAKAVLS